jgi:2,4-dienoyl-CoA reductase-like NADH-dependent reductase (Old Yellow Enzyme family)/thioredoxin reductase
LLKEEDRYMPLKNLLSPIKIGTITVRNRIVFPPIDAALHTEGKAVDPRYIEFLSSLVEKNGVGLVISEFTAVANGNFWLPASRIDKDEFIPGFKEMVDRVHSHDAKIFMQLAMLGGRAPTGRAIAPSAIESPLYPGIPEELTIDEIRWLVDKWVEGALRAQKAGFDGVEIHGGHTYLLGEFMSPHANRREDEYGSDFNGRMKLPVEIIGRVKIACGNDYPVGIKFSAYESLENGITGPMSIDIAKRLEYAGADYLHVSSSTYMVAGTRYPDVPPMFVPEGPLVEFAEKIKKQVSVPVITVAGIASPEFADEIIAGGRADMVAVGRAMFADLHWASKVAEGKESDIVHCIRCNVCHKHIVIDRAGAVKCTVNPGLLREEVKPALKEKKVAVVGAGPAGLEAALRASERGHKIFLFEKNISIGGTAKLGCIPSFKKDLLFMIDRYEKLLKKSRVKLISGSEVTPAKIIEEKFDAAVIAVGAEENIPDLPGIAQPEVLNAKEFYLRKSSHKKGKGRVGIIGAGSVGCELAWHLSLIGRKVYLIDILPYSKWLPDEHPTNRFILLENIEAEDIDILDRANIIELGEKGKSIRLEREKVEYRILLDEIVLAAGYRGSAGFSRELRELAGKNSSLEIFEIGDCAGARDIHWAIREGYDIGTTI